MVTRSSHPRAWAREWPAQRERRAYVAPLFAYCRAYGIKRTWLLRRVAQRRGYRMYFSKERAIERGWCVIPPHFIADCCRALGRSPIEVMGVPWVVRHAADLVQDSDADVDADAGADCDLDAGLSLVSDPPRALTTIR